MPASQKGKDASEAAPRRATRASSVPASTRSSTRSSSASSSKASSPERATKTNAPKEVEPKLRKTARAMSADRSPPRRVLVASMDGIPEQALHKDSTLISKDDAPAVGTPKRKGRASINPTAVSSPVRVTRRSVAAHAVEEELQQLPASPARSSRRRTLVSKDDMSKIEEEPRSHTSSIEVDGAGSQLPASPARPTRKRTLMPKEVAEDQEKNAHDLNKIEEESRSRPSSAELSQSDGAASQETTPKEHDEIGNEGKPVEKEAMVPKVRSPRKATQEQATTVSKIPKIDDKNASLSKRLVTPNPIDEESCADGARGEEIASDSQAKIVEEDKQGETGRGNVKTAGSMLPKSTTRTPRSTAREKATPEAEIEALTDRKTSVPREGSSIPTRIPSRPATPVAKSPRTSVELRSSSSPSPAGRSRPSTPVAVSPRTSMELRSSSNSSPTGRSTPETPVAISPRTSIEMRSSSKASPDRHVNCRRSESPVASYSPVRRSPRNSPVRQGRRGSGDAGTPMISPLAINMSPKAVNGNGPVEKAKGLAAIDEADDKNVPPDEDLKTANDEESKRVTESDKQDGGNPADDTKNILHTETTSVLEEESLSEAEIKAAEEEMNRLSPIKSIPSPVEIDTSTVLGKLGLHSPKPATSSHSHKPRTPPKDSEAESSLCPPSALDATISPCRGGIGDADDVNSSINLENSSMNESSFEERGGADEDATGKAHVGGGVVQGSVDVEDRKNSPKRKSLEEPILDTTPPKQSKLSEDNENGISKWATREKLTEEANESGGDFNLLVEDGDLKTGDVFEDSICEIPSEVHQLSPVNNRPANTALSPIKELEDFITPVKRSQACHVEGSDKKAVCSLTKDVSPTGDARIVQTMEAQQSPAKRAKTPLLRSATYTIVKADGVLTQCGEGLRAISSEVLIPTPSGADQPSPGKMLPIPTEAVKQSPSKKTVVSPTDEVMAGKSVATPTEEVVTGKTVATPTEAVKQSPSKKTVVSPADEDKAGKTVATPIKPIKQSPSKETVVSPTDEDKAGKTMATPTEAVKQSPSKKTVVSPADEDKAGKTVATPTKPIKQSPSKETVVSPTHEDKAGKTVPTPTEAVKQSPSKKTVGSPTNDSRAGEAMATAVEVKQSPSKKAVVSPTDEVMAGTSVATPIEEVVTGKIVATPTEAVKQSPSKKTVVSPTDDVKAGEAMATTVGEVKQSPSKEIVVSPADEVMVGQAVGTAVEEVKQSLSEKVVVSLTDAVKASPSTETAGSPTKYVGSSVTTTMPDQIEDMVSSPVKKTATSPIKALRFSESVVVARVEEVPSNTIRDIMSSPTKGVQPSLFKEFIPSLTEADENNPHLLDEIASSPTKNNAPSPVAESIDSGNASEEEGRIAPRVHSPIIENLQEESEEPPSLPDLNKSFPLSLQKAGSPEVQPPRPTEVVNTEDIEEVSVSEESEEEVKSTGDEDNEKEVVHAKDFIDDEAEETDGSDDSDEEVTEESDSSSEYSDQEVMDVSSFIVNEAKEKKRKSTKLAEKSCHIVEEPEEEAEEEPAGVTSAKQNPKLPKTKALMKPVFKEEVMREPSKAPAGSGNFKSSTAAGFVVGSLPAPQRSKKVDLAVASSSATNFARSVTFEKPAPAQKRPAADEATEGTKGAKKRATEGADVRVRAPVGASYLKLTNIPKGTTIPDVKRALREFGIAQGLLSIKFADLKFKNRNSLIADVVYDTQEHGQKAIGSFGLLKIKGQRIFFLNDEDKVCQVPQDPPKKKSPLKKQKFVGILSGLSPDVTMYEIIQAYADNGVSHISKIMIFKRKSINDGKSFAKIEFSKRTALLKALIVSEGLRIGGKPVKMTLKEAAQS